MDIRRRQGVLRGGEQFGEQRMVQGIHLAPLQGDHASAVDGADVEEFHDLDCTGRAGNAV